MAVANRILKRMETEGFVQPGGKAKRYKAKIKCLSFSYTYFFYKNMEVPLDVLNQYRS